MCWVKKKFIPAEEIRQCIQPAVQTLASAIANTILELNNKAPQAILLVGGGSLTEGLDKSLAQAFNLPGRSGSSATS